MFCVFWQGPGGAYVLYVYATDAMVSTCRQYCMGGEGWGACRPDLVATSEVENGRGIPSPADKGVHGNVVSSPSVVRGKARRK